jgi:hypothetical protein
MRPYLFSEKGGGGDLLPNTGFGGLQATPC